MYMYMYIVSTATQCGGCFAANSRPYQLCWGDRECGGLQVAVCAHATVRCAHCVGRSCAFPAHTQLCRPQHALFCLVCGVLHIYMYVVFILQFPVANNRCVHTYPDRIWIGTMWIQS